MAALAEVEKMTVLRLLIFSLLLLFPFGQLTKIPLMIPGVSLYLQDIVISLLLLVFIFNHLLERKSFHWPPLTMPIFIFIAVSILSLLVNVSRLKFDELFISSLYLLRWSAYAGIYFVVYELVSNKATCLAGRQAKQQSNKVLELLTLVGVIVAIFGLLQYFLYPNLRNLYYLDWDPHQYRVFGTFFDPGFLGIILVLTLILLLSLPVLNWMVQASFALLVFLALMLTYSRSSYLALIVGVVLLAAFKKSLRLLFIPLSTVLFVALSSFLPRPAGEGVKLERQSTVLSRVENWRQTLAIIGDYPLLGVGFNSLRFAKRDYRFLDENWRGAHSGAGADSSLLFVWATTGIVGLGVYLWMWWKVIQKSSLISPPSEESLRFRFGPPRRCLYRFSRSLSKTSSIVIIPSVIALFIHSLFLNSLFYPWIMVWMWMLLGISHSQLKWRRQL